MSVLTPLFANGMARLVYDPTTDDQILGLDEPLVASISKLADRQVVRQWFIYTRNRASREDHSLVEVVVEGNGHCSEQLLSVSIAREARFWLSFSGTELFVCGMLKLTEVTTGNVSSKENASKVTTVHRWLPRYEASPKHGLSEKTLDGEIVSVMDLDETEAQTTLILSIEHTDRRRYGRVRGVCYEFRLTRNDSGQGIYHGFRVAEESVPQAILARL